MSTIKIPLETADAKQLRVFCVEHLGLTDVPPLSNGVQLRAKIAGAGWTDDFIILPEDAKTLQEGARAELGEDTRSSAEIAEGMAGRALFGAGSKHDPVVVCTVHQSNEVGGQRALYCNVNGRDMLVPRGEQIKLPYRYYLMLQDAVAAEGRQAPGGDLIMTATPAFPISVALLPSAAEIAEWHRRTDNLIAA